MKSKSQTFQLSLGPQTAVGFGEFKNFDAGIGFGANVQGAYLLKSGLSFTVAAAHLSFPIDNYPDVEDETTKFTTFQAGARFGGHPGDFYAAAALGFCLLGGDFTTKTPQFAPSFGGGYLLKIKKNFIDFGLNYNHISLNDRQWNNIALKVAFGFQFGKTSTGTQDK